MSLYLNVFGSTQSSLLPLSSMATLLLLEYLTIDADKAKCRGGLR